MSVELTDKGGRCAALGMSNGTWFTLLDIPGVETLFNTRKTNDPIDCTRSKARKLADLIEAWEPPDHWFSGIGNLRERRFSSLSCVTARGFALADITGAPAPSS